MCLVDGLDEDKDLEELESRLDSSIVTPSLTPKAKEDTNQSSDILKTSTFKVRWDLTLKQVLITKPQESSSTQCFKTLSE